MLNLVVRKVTGRLLKVKNGENNHGKYGVVKYSYIIIDA
jgi:hypothetical protein